MSINVKRLPLFNCLSKSCPKYKCQKCDHFHTDLLVDMRNHMDNNCAYQPSVLQTHTCEICNFSTDSYFMLLVHNLEHERATKGKRLKTFRIVHFKCEYCDFNISDEDALARHQLVEHGINSDIHWIRCQHCTYKSSPGNVQKHVKCRHGVWQEFKWFYCESCPYQTNSKSSLRVHVLRKHKNGLERFKCEECDSEYLGKTSWKDHVRQKHCPEKSVTWFQCDHCPFKTRWKGNFKKHNFNKHTSTRWLKCDRCYFKTCRAACLKRHTLSKHTDRTEKRYHCNKCCFTTDSKNSFYQHKVLHVPENKKKWLKCEHCSYKSLKSHNLKGHVMRRHTSEELIKWFKCGVCGHKTKSKGALKAHAKKHQE